MFYQMQTNVVVSELRSMLMNTVSAHEEAFIYPVRNEHSEATDEHSWEGRHLLPMYAYFYRANEHWLIRRSFVSWKCSVFCLFSSLLAPLPHFPLFLLMSHFCSYPLNNSFFRHVWHIFLHIFLILLYKIFFQNFCIFLLIYTHFCPFQLCTFFIFK